MRDSARAGRQTIVGRISGPRLQPFRDVLIAWGISRLFFLVVGGVGHAFFSAADFVGTYRAPPGTLSYWANWDGAWFTHIAQQGYDSTSATAFFPLYPILIRAVMELGVPPPIAGVLVSMLGSLVALFFVYRLAQHWFDVRVARAAVLALALFPSSLFLGAAYGESVFIAVTAGALWALYIRRDIFLAGVLGCLGALTRNVGVLLVIPLAYEWIRRRREFGREGLVGVLGPLAGLGAYWLYLWKGTHNSLPFAAAQKETWGREISSPLRTVAHGWEQADDGLGYLFHPERIFGTRSANPPFSLSATMSFVLLVLVLVLVVLAFRKLPLPVAVYCLLVATAPLFLPGPQIALIGYPRYALAPVPLFLVLGSLLARSRRRLCLWLATSCLVALYLTLEFVTLRWVA